MTSGTSSNSPNDYFIERPDGARFWLHGTLGSFDGEQRNLGSPYFEYHDIYSAGGSGHGATNRQYLAFGARTQDANLPVGTASYSGVVRAESHPTDSLESPGMRGRLEGNWRLTADFSESTLRGDIRLLVVRPPGGESGWRVLPHTTYFRIENGQIVNGQFTASLSGVDSRPHPARDETVEGFEGDMLGEFYGPGGEEAGGVLRAARSSDNRVLTGAFGGKRMPELTPSLPAGDLSVQSVGIDRDYVATSVRTTDEVEVTAIESDGANGFHVTYRVDGTDHRVHLVEQIYVNRYDEFGLFNDQAGRLFGLSDQTGSFAGTPEFSHFAVHGWAVGTYADDGTPQSTFRGFVVSGVPIAASGLPAGGATYAGRAHFLTWPSNNPRLSAHVRGDGRLVLTANFDASTVGGTIDRIGDVLGPIAEVAIQNGAIHDGQLTADLRGVQTGATFDGDMTGRFYGAGAAEVGGVLKGSLTHTQTATVVQGWFGGEKQQ